MKRLSLEDLIDYYIEQIPPPPRLAQIRLTESQMAALPKAGSPRPQWPYGADVVPLLIGIPIVRVDTIQDSTPWTEGWITCPHCDTPACGHPGDSDCDATVSAMGKMVVFARPVDFENVWDPITWRPQP